MRFMSKHFYSYLANKIEIFFSETMLQPGDKYHIQFERIEQVVELIEQIQLLNNTEQFRYSTPGGIYKAFCLRVNGVKLLVASTIHDTTPDFLTTLRNKVGTDESYFQDKAMLLVHNSSLDSLVQGMSSFSKEGMPFHLLTVENDLNLMLSKSKFSDSEKEVLEFIMSKLKNEQTYQEQITLFDYEYILQVLRNQKLECNDYD